MILVLGYNKSETDILNKIFEKNNIDYKYSLLESDILNSDKIILPESQNFSSAYRNMNMMNLFSILRMVKKPILGINNGYKLMCNQLLNNSKCGLGFFNIDVEVREENSSEDSFANGEIIIAENCKLLKSLPFNSVLFNKDIQLEAFDCSKIIINSNEKKYSLLHEYKNFYGLEINFAQNSIISEQIITKFAKL